jgi:hypothetical protein
LFYEYNNNNNNNNNNNIQIVVAGYWYSIWYPYELPHLTLPDDNTLPSTKTHSEQHKQVYHQDKMLQESKPITYRVSFLMPVTRRHHQISDSMVQVPERTEALQKTSPVAAHAFLRALIRAASSSKSGMLGCTFPLDISGCMDKDRTGAFAFGFGFGLEDSEGRDTALSGRCADAPSLLESSPAPSSAR